MGQEDRARGGDQHAGALRVAGIQAHRLGNRDVSGPGKRVERAGTIAVARVRINQDVAVGQKGCWAVGDIVDSWYVRARRPDSGERVVNRSVAGGARSSIGAGREDHSVGH